MGRRRGKGKRSKPQGAVAQQSSQQDASGSSQPPERTSERGLGNRDGDFERNLRKAFATAGREEHHSAFRARERARATLAVRMARLDKNDKHAVESMNLMAAAQQGDVELAQEALLLGADPDKLMFEQGISAVHMAAQQGHKSILRLFFDNGASVNTADKKNLTALHYAAASGSLETVKYLVSNMADINACGLAFETPLGLAASENHADVVKYLIGCGAKMHCVYGEHSALQIASKRNSAEAAQVLLDHGADVDLLDRSGATPLHTAAAQGALQTMAVLLKAGADPNAEMIDIGMTPLELVVDWGEQSEQSCFEHVDLLLQYGATFDIWSAESLVQSCHQSIGIGDKKMVRIFLQHGCDPNGAVDEEEDMRLLGFAAAMGDVEVGNLLINYGADMGVEPSPFTTAVKFNQPRFLEFLMKRKACRSALGALGFDNRLCMQIVALEAQLDVTSRKEMIKVLIQNGISINEVVDASSNTVLHEAAETGKVGTVRILVELGANVNAKNRCGSTPLVLACRNKKFETAKILVEKGKANVNCRDSDHAYALYEAVRHNMPDLVKLLLDSGAAVDLVGPDGLTPLLIAVNMSEPSFVKLLLDAGADTSRHAADFLICAIKNEDLNTLRALLDAGINVNEYDDDGDLPLCVACRLDMPMSVKLLLDAGADVNKLSDSGETALISAVIGTAENDIIEMLLAAGANVNAVSDNNETALIIAVDYGCIDTVCLLLEHGADPRICDSNHMPPSVIAARLGFTDIESLLKERIRTLEQEVLKAANQSRQQSSKNTAGACSKQSEPEAQLVSEMEQLFLCPITLEIMEDPVVAPDGHSYERSAITMWLRSHGRSPMTQQDMDAGNLIPNWNLKQQIEVYLKCQKREK